jgi:hypothetical protein
MGGGDLVPCTARGASTSQSSASSPPPVSFVAGGDVTVLRIQHEAAGEGMGRFSVQRVRSGDVKSAESVAVPSPYAQEVAGRPNQRLMELLQWYLERYLEYPYPPNSDVARAVEAIGIAARAFVRCYAKLPQPDRAELRQAWLEAGFSPEALHEATQLPGD